MEIRIVPMSLEDEEFQGKNIKEVQKDFFEGYLKNEGKGWYNYAKSGLDAKEGDLILFQMDNQIIASATLEQVLPFGKPIDNTYFGAYVLYEDTIKTFDPISKEEISKIIPGLKSFTQAKQRFNEKEVDLELLKQRTN